MIMVATFITGDSTLNIGTPAFRVPVGTDFYEVHADDGTVGILVVRDDDDPAQYNKQIFHFSSNLHGQLHDVARITLDNERVTVHFSNGHQLLLPRGSILTNCRKDSGKEHCFEIGETVEDKFGNVLAKWSRILAGLNLANEPDQNNISDAEYADIVDSFLQR